MSHGKRIRLRHFCKNVLHETYLVKFKFEKLCKNWKTDVLSLLLNYCPSERYLYFYLSRTNHLIYTTILKCFVNQIVFQRSNMTQVTIAIKVIQRENDISSTKITKTTVRIAAKNLKQNTVFLAWIQRIKKIESKKLFPTKKLQTINIDVWKYPLRISCTKNALDWIIF